jgi:hypothetical protein
MTPGRATALVDILEQAPGFVTRWALAFVVGFVLTAFIGLRRLGATGRYAHSGSSLGIRLDVACIEVTSGQVGSVWVTLGAGKRFRMLCLALTTVLTSDHCVSVVASSGDCEDWISPGEGESTPGWSTSAGRRPVERGTLGATARYASIPISVPGPTTSPGSCHSCIKGVDSSSPSGGREDSVHIEKANKRLGSVRAANGTGEHWIMLVSSSLTAFLASGCPIVKEGGPSSTGDEASVMRHDDFISG